LGSRVKVLMVEDDEVIADALSFMLTGAGFSVEVAHSGREGLAMVETFAPDVVVIDLSLPDVGGDVVAFTIRSDWPEMGLIISTGHDRPAQLERLLGDGRTLFLQKPYDVDSLEAMIRGLAD